MIFITFTIANNPIPTITEDTAIISAKPNFIVYETNNKSKNSGKAITGFKSASNNRSIHITKKLKSFTSNKKNVPKNKKLDTNMPRTEVFKNIKTIKIVDNKKLTTDNL